jgi:diguanylate cyclase (GGDEF)-like protein/PAS domain S-box-containing protein
MRTGGVPDSARPGRELGPSAPEDRARRAVQGPGARADPDLGAERLRLAFEDSPIGMAIEDLDGRFLQVNLALCAMVGYTAEQLLGMGYQQVCHPDDLEDPAYLESLRNGTVRRVIRELRYIRADGSVFWVRVHIGVIPGEDGQARFYTVQIEDISQHHAAEQRFRSAFADAAVGMAVAGASGGPDDVVVEANAAMARLLGRSPAELAGRSVTDFADDRDAAAVRELFASLQVGACKQAEVDARFVCPDGSVVWAHLSASVSEEGDGSQNHLVLHLQDITARKSAESKLIHQAEFDALTDLPNRLAFSRRVAAALAAGHAPALLFVDLDRFKLVNDTLGHATGDEVLSAVGSRLRDVVRGDDVVARIGGDEFVVLAVSARSRDEAETMAARLHAVLSAPYQVAGRPLFLTASIGVALPGERAHSAEDVLRAADIAMYSAKTSGKARTAVFDASMRRKADTRLAVEQDLHHAIVTPGELLTWFQPVVSVPTGRVVAVEALARWNHPQRGLLLPAQFLPVAEETGLTSAIGRTILTEALAQGRRWRHQGLKMLVSVNLSGRQLEDPELEGDIVDSLRHAGLSPAELCLEVTETAIFDAANRGAHTIQRLRELGVAVAIDDFGQGYSSLSFLRSHPVDVVKIDIAFVAALETNPRDAAIVGGMVELAHALGMTCVAKGVERSGQLRHLAELGCDQVEGFLLGRPCPAEELSGLLRAGSHGEAPSLATNTQLHDLPR